MNLHRNVVGHVESHRVVGRHFVGFWLFTQWDSKISGSGNDFQYAETYAGSNPSIPWHVNSPYGKGNQEGYHDYVVCY